MRENGYKLVAEKFTYKPAVAIYGFDYRGVNFCDVCRELCIAFVFIIFKFFNNSGKPGKINSHCGTRKYAELLGGFEAVMYKRWRIVFHNNSLLLKTPFSFGQKSPCINFNIIGQ